MLFTNQMAAWLNRYVWLWMPASSMRSMVFQVKKLAL